MQDVLHVTSNAFLVIGLATVPVAVCTALPQATIRPVTRLISHTVYRLTHGRGSPRDRRLLGRQPRQWLDRRSPSAVPSVRMLALPITSAGVRGLAYERLRRHSDQGQRRAQKAGQIAAGDRPPVYP